MPDFEMRWYGKEVLADIRTREGDLLDAIATELHPVIQANTPVKTGKLRANWNLDVDRHAREIRITNNMPYWVYLELGTRYVSARRMVSRSLAEFAPRARWLGGTYAGGAVSRTIGAVRRLFDRVKRPGR